jgi:hypothetical protein
MKNKEEIVYITESEELEELANNSGEFIDFVLGTIRDRIDDCQLIKDHKGAATLKDLFDVIIEKLEEDQA